MPILIISTGSALPEQIVTNHDLAKNIDTSHEWIVERTGIHQRHVANAEKGETSSTLATDAARIALERAGVSPSQVGAVIVGTTSPDCGFPNTANLVQKNLGIRGIGFDLSAACSGFIYSLFTAKALMESHDIDYLLLIGVDCMSHFINWEDRSTSILFGDGAGAVVLKKASQEEAAGRGVVDVMMAGSGYDRDDLWGNKTDGIIMNGREVFKQAVREMVATTEALLQKNNLAPEDIDWVVAHQANQRILDAVAKAFNLPDEKMVSTIAKQANTSAATIPMALDIAINDGRIKPNDLLCFTAFGAGFTWGSALVRW